MRWEKGRWTLSMKLGTLKKDNLKEYAEYMCFWINRKIKAKRKMIVNQEL